MILSKWSLFDIHSLPLKSLYKLDNIGDLLSRTVVVVSDQIKLNFIPLSFSVCDVEFSPDSCYYNTIIIGVIALLINYTFF